MLVGLSTFFYLGISYPWKSIFIIFYRLVSEFTNHHYFSRGLSSSKKNQTFFGGDRLTSHVVLLCSESHEDPGRLVKIPMVELPYVSKEALK